MKQTLRYDQPSCRLRVDGLPDVSTGQSADALGIITAWSLQWSGRPELEGRKDHLLALVAVVLPYARHLISGVGRPFGAVEDPVRIAPAPESGHHCLQLRSSQPDTAPLELKLDDAELTDLVRLLDQFRLDPRLQLKLDLPEPRPLRPREVLRRVPRRQRLVAPLAGALAVVVAAGVGLLLPDPPARSPQPRSVPAGPAPDAAPERQS